MSNRKTGNEFESEFCELLFQYGFWAHNIAQNQAGQPADIIAVNGKNSFLIDCKVCSSKGFAISRIEPNQDSAMQLWKERVNEHAFFAMLLPNEEIRMVGYDVMKKFEQEGKKYIPISALQTSAELFSQWVETWL